MSLAIKNRFEEYYTTHMRKVKDLGQKKIKNKKRSKNDRMVY